MSRYAKVSINLNYNRSYPFTENDPLAITKIDQFPDVIFSGLASKFEYKDLELKDDKSAFLKKIHVMCIPDFSKTNSFVIYNTNTSESLEISLDIVI